MKLTICLLFTSMFVPIISMGKTPEPSITATCREKRVYCQQQCPDNTCKQECADREQACEVLEETVEMF